jgi:hypothetical protein
MPSSEPSIFRDRALKKYYQRQEQGVILRAASPPAFILCWIVLLFLLGAGGLAWTTQVPVSINGQGVVVEQSTTGHTGHEVVAVLFFSPDQLAVLHVGQSATVSIGPTAINVAGTVEQIERAVISPNEARSRFNLQGELAQVITGPSIIITIHINSVASTQAYAGSLCSAQVNVGSQRVLSLLPVFNQIFGK